VQFRTKKEGWKLFNFDMTYDQDGQYHNISSWHQENHYMRVFLRDVILRPSCYDCRAKGGRSGSDLTIADFWGIGQLNPNMDDDLGTSLVMVYSEKGAVCFNALQLNSWEAKYEDVLRLNPSVVQSAKVHPKRRMFFARLDTDKSTVSLMESTLHMSFLLSLKKRMKRLLLRVWGFYDSFVVLAIFSVSNIV
jgi:hypothetical protein